MFTVPNPPDDPEATPPPDISDLLDEGYDPADFDDLDGDAEGDVPPPPDDEAPLPDDDETANNVRPIRPAPPGIVPNGFTDWANAFDRTDEITGLPALLAAGVPAERAIHVSAGHADVAEAFAAAQDLRLLIPTDDGAPLMWGGVAVGWERINPRRGAKLVSLAMRNGLIVPLKWVGIDDKLEAELVAAGVASRNKTGGLVDTNGHPLTAWPFPDRRFAASATNAEAIWRLVAGTEELQIDPKAFDADPEIINARGTVIDLSQPDSGDWVLRTRPLRRSDLITQSLGCALPDDLSVNHSPIWTTEFMPQFTSYRDKQTREIVYRQDLARYIQVCNGLTMLGDNREQMLLILHAHAGNNGKSVFANTVRKMWGAYGTTLPKAVLMEKRADSHTTDLTMVRGKRGAQINEVAHGRWDTEVAKDLASSEDIVARRMRENNEESPSTQVPWVTTNHTPLVAPSQHAFWKRVNMIPCDQRWSRPKDTPAMKRFSIAPQDPQLEKKLREELSGILMWALEGLRIYYAEGLVIPKCVDEATKKAQGGGSLWAQFAGTHLVVTGEPAHTVSTTGLLKCWKHFRKANSDFDPAPGGVEAMLELLLPENPDLQYVPSSTGGRNHTPAHLVGLALTPTGGAAWNATPDMGNLRNQASVVRLDDDGNDADNVWGC